MNKIILAIRKELELQRLSETKLAEKAGLTQVKVSRLLNGTTKRIDPEVITKLQLALGIVADPETVYGVETIHRTLSPEQEKLLQILETMPDVRLAVEGLAGLPERKVKIHVGRILEDLDKIEEEKG